MQRENVNNYINSTIKLQVLYHQYKKKKERRNYTLNAIITPSFYFLISYLLLLDQMQYDYGGWMPNTPISLQLPPPTTKGTTSEATMLATFPDVNVTVQGMATVWLLSKQSSDFVSSKDFIKNDRNYV